MRSSFFLVMVLIALSIPAAWHILTPGFFPMHDDTQVARVYEMHKALLGGQFPVRWVADLGYGYGYPIFNFYNPLPYYLGGGLMFLGFDALAATKLMMAIPIFLSTIFMFLLARSLFPEWIASVVSLLYAYAPYHGVQIYVRGAVAEYWAYALLPLVFWAMRRKHVLITAMSLAAIILSHNLTAFMSIPFISALLLFEFFKTGKRKHMLLIARRYSLVVVFALGISAFFWLPAIAEAPKTRLSQMVFQEFDPPSKHLVAFSQLWSSPWGYGGSSPGQDDGLSLQIGKIQLIGSIIAIVTLLYGYGAGNDNFLLVMKQYSHMIMFLVIGLLFSLFMMSSPSKFVWDSFPTLSYIQFPWRLLTFASFFASLLSGLAISFFSKTLTKNYVMIKQFLFITGCSLFTIYSFRFFQPQFKYATTVAEQTSREKIVWEISRRSDEYLPIGFIRPESQVEALIGGNTYSQQLVDELKSPTIMRRIGNLISLLTLIVVVGYHYYGSRIRW